MLYTKFKNILTPKFTKFIVIYVLFIVTFAFVYLLPNLYSVVFSAQINQLNQLNQDLNLELNIVQEYSLNPQFRFKQLLNNAYYLSKLPEHNAQKQSIISNFNSQVTEYATKIKSYSYLNTSFLPADVNQIDFKIKLDAFNYLQQLKASFKQSLVTYNSDPKNTIVRYELDPQLEVNTMSLDEKIGNLFMFSTTGTQLSQQQADSFKKNYTGGLTYFASNVINADQLSKFSKSIQSTNPKYPVFIAVDQEGGMVKRLFWDTTPDPKALAKLDEQEQCEQWKQRSTTLASSGINWNLGIVADFTSNINSFIYPRVLGSNLETTITAVGIAAKCTINNISTLKHWPGHGATTVDTHQQLGVLSSQSKTDWLSTDFAPFKSGIENNADSIMVGHLIVNWLDASKPASLSKTDINFLRNELDYKGLIVTDSLTMLLNSGYSLNDAVTQALIAGNDILFIVEDNIPKQEELINTAKQLVLNQTISETELNQKLVRILAAKNKIITSSSTFIPAELIY